MQYSEKQRTKKGIFMNKTDINKALLTHKTIPVIHTLRRHLASTTASVGG